MAAAAVASQPESLPGISGRDSQKAVSLKDVHILLVDDERLSRVVVGNLLRKCFYKGTATILLMMLRDLPRQDQALQVPGVGLLGVLMNAVHAINGL